MAKRVQGENIQTAKSVKDALRLGVPTGENGNRAFPGKLNDGGSLSLEIRKAGSGSWVYRASIAGTGKKVAVTLGDESLSLADARIRRDEARILAMQGINPNLHRKAMIEANATEDARNSLTYEDFAKRWIESPAKVRRASENTRKDDWGRLAFHALPYIGSKQFRKVSRADMVAIIERMVSADKVASAKKLITVLSQIDGYAVDIGEIDHSRTERLCRLVPSRKPSEIRHRAAITDRAGIGELLRRIHSLSDFRRSPVMCLALRIMPYVATRSNELRGAMWHEIDWEQRVWRIPESRMKMRVAFNVPMSSQVFALFKELRTFTGNQEYIFPSRSGAGYITDNGLLMALRKGCGVAKDEQCIHGFRSIWKTLTKEEGLPEILQEEGYAHAVGSSVSRAYDRTDLFEARRILSQWWADFLDALRDCRPTPQPPIRAWSIAEQIQSISSIRVQSH